MTTRAREALADCEHALHDFERSANTLYQRPRWVALVTLLRSVGLVLKAVDHPAAMPDVQKRIDDAWRQLNASKPEPRIFHDFIDAERYAVVHLYDIAAAVNVTVKIPASRIDWMPVVVDARGGTDTTTYDFFMRKGPTQGRDPRELYREAIKFWRGYLDEIDSSDKTIRKEGDSR
jgi:hypothetical protein